MPREVNTDELAAMLRAKRGTRGLREIAREIGEVSSSTLSRIEQGKVPDLDTFVRLCRWLGVTTDRFMSPEAADAASSTPKTEAVVSAYLKADRNLDVETANALVQMIHVAYLGIKQGKLGKSPKTKGA